MPDDPLPEPPGDLLARPGPPVGWRDRLERLADATGSSPGRIGLGGLAVIAAVVGAGWLLRPPADPPEVSLPFASTTTTAAPSPPTAPEALVVHVAGAVLAPGVYDLPPGARVLDAVEAAGGLAAAADPLRLNLAAPVHDGERVYVLAIGEDAAPPAAGPGSPGVGPAGPAGPVDINAADQAALEALPGIGPATAAAIIEHRARIGRFESVDQLLDVPGIGEAKLAALRDLVRV